MKRKRMKMKTKIKFDLVADTIVVVVKAKTV